jgi:5,10-methylenetetrahydromethanopterin reductase
MSAQIWQHLFPVPGRCEAAAVRAEELGFDGVLLADSQNLVGDTFVELGVLARATSRLGLGTGIVNPVTRHPAVVAAAIASVQIESGGRAVLGVGRGDSSLAQLGLPAPTTRAFGEFLRQVRGYLDGSFVKADGHTSRISWIADAAQAPIPIEVAATGPRTIELAALDSTRVMLTVGADPDRIRWGIDVARAARVRAGLDPAELRIGAYLNVGCHADLHTACGLVRGSTAIFAHFSSMSAGATTALAVADASVIDRVGATYDERRHGLSDAKHVSELDDAFIQRFAVVGSAEHCAGRLRELIDLGLDRVVVVAGSRDTDPALLAETNTAFAREVLPTLK